VSCVCFAYVVIVVCVCVCVVFVFGAWWVCVECVACVFWCM